MCRVLEVSRAGYYRWLAQQSAVPSDLPLRVAIREVFEGSEKRYGSPRVWDALRKRFKVGRARIARMMREMGLVARFRRKRVSTTDSAHDQPIAPNVLNRDFNPAAPNQAWVTDITYIRTEQGWLYLAVVMDLFSRRVIGWAADDNLRTELVLDAFRTAISRRLPSPGLVHHSDRGSQYASHAYQQVLAQHGVICSMSRSGNCWDNAVIESFFSTLKTELVHRVRWATKSDARSALIRYIEIFYNSKRKHSSLGYRSPAEYERTYWERSVRTA